jgi:FO synthase
MAGSENGSLKTIAQLEALAAGIGRPARQRTTGYGAPPAERLATARSEEGRRRLTLSVTPA